MKVIITGVKGQVGFELYKELLSRNHTVLGTDLGEKPQDFDSAYLSLDIQDASLVDQAIQDFQPDAVFHCAAWTAVDAAELEENKDKVYAINAGGTANIAKACAKTGAKLLYLSTDYVFSGEGFMPIKPECTDFSPISSYGESKLLGEKAIIEEIDNYYIVRTSWIFGGHGHNFVKTMLELAKDNTFIEVVNDQIGRPTYARDLAVLLADMSEQTAYGIYHASNEGPFVSWAEYSKEIFRIAQLNNFVDSITTEEYRRNIANRPKNSRLDTSKLKEMGFSPLPEWQESLKNFLQEVSNGHNPC